MDESIKVLVADDQKLVREGITSLLEIQENIQVVAMAQDGEEAATLCRELKPNIVLLDIRMPGTDGIEAAKIIHREVPQCRIIMLTTFNDDEYIVKSLSAGACGYLLKDIPAADLAKAIRLAHSGVHQFDPSVTGKLLGRINSQAYNREEIDPEISPREREVIGLIARGLSNKEIGEILYVSEGTIKNHVSSILSKLQMRDRIQIAMYAVRTGITEIP